MVKRGFLILSLTLKQPEGITLSAAAIFMVMSYTAGQALHTNREIGKTGTESRTLTVIGSM